MARLAAVALALLPLITVACSGDDGSSSPGDDARPSASRSPQEPLTGPVPPSPATRLFETPAPPLHGPDGSFLVVLGPTWPGEHTLYRVFDREWRPMTPLLHARYSLSFAMATPDGFLAQATKQRPDGRRAFPDEWVIVTPDGQLRRLGRQPHATGTPRPLGNGQALGLEWAGLAYDPDSSTVFRWKPPDQVRPLRLALDFDGDLCTAGGRGPSEGLFASVDGGQTLRRVPLPSAVPRPVRVLRCAATEKRLAVMTAQRGRYGAPTDVRVHVLTWSGRHLADHPLGRRALPDMELLPDGRLVMGAPGPGLLVGTDPTNQRLVHRPGTITRSFSWDVVGGDLYATPPAGHRKLWVSRDAARTWQPIDLQLDDLPGARERRGG